MQIITKDVKRGLRLTKLELHGFKSFARKTELLFDEGITAVIGPNGSGKSNISDAVRWVLGEQSAKALRGGRMEDVIFNGTQERKPQAYCEAALTFDNSDGALPLEFREVTITRRVYRSGESEYAINRNNCRLKDIQELFRDTGIGKAGYSVIGQGKVEEILSNKSGDRRAALEEAAGVMKYRSRKEEAVRKLEHTGKNIERIEDILAELLSQREPLQENSEKARKYLSLMEELRELEINVFLYQYDRSKEKLSALAAVLSQMQDEGEAMLSSELALSKEYLAEESALRALEETAANLQNQLLSLMSGVEAHSGEANVLKERKEHLYKEKERLFDALQADKNRSEELLIELGKLEESGVSGKDMLSELESQIFNNESELDIMQQEIDEQEHRLNEQKNSIIESLNRLSDAKSQLSRLEAMAQALSERMETIKAQQDKLSAENIDIQSEKEGAVLAMQKQELACKALSSEQEELQAALVAAQEQSNAQSIAVRELEQAENAMRSRAAVIKEMARAYEGYYSSVRNVLKDCETDNGLSECVLGVVADLLNVPAEYETALEMALGPALQYIVTPTPNHAKRVIEHLRLRAYGRATLLPVSAMRPRLLNSEEKKQLLSHDCLGVASDLITYDEKYRAVIENLLGRTVIVKDLEAGIALNKRAGAAFRIATLKGDIIHPGGSMTGGSIQKREFSLLGREREYRELELRISEAEHRTVEQISLFVEAKDKVLACSKALEGAGARLHVEEVETARQKEKLELIERDLNQNKLARERSELENAQLNDNMADILKQRSEIEQVHSGLALGSTSTQEDVECSQKQLSELRAKLDLASKSLVERKIQRMAIQKEEDAVRLERQRLAREHEQAEASYFKNTALLEASKEQESSLDEQLSLYGGQISKEQARADAVKDEYHLLEEERQKLQQALADLRNRKDELNTSLRELEEKKHKQALSQSRAELEFSAMNERMQEEYTLTYEEALSLKTQMNGVAATHMRIDELKKEVRALGNINVNAIEDYKALNERYEGLKTQCADLRQAEADLNKVIADLTSTMQKQFLKQFQLIQKHFSEVFEQLFGGGWAELRLSDPKDVLSCEIDIIAQPPGKKLQLLTLLSGGERALTAIALLFAMLKLKPIVFCILDEIESSLDEVNVTQFANFLKEYAQDTQFILITHRKGSMEVCNALYGVAMEEKGVSKIVSARFQSAS